MRMIVIPLLMAFILAHSLSIRQTKAQAREVITQQPKISNDFFPVDVSVPIAPTPVQNGARMHLVYELHVTNFQASDLTLTMVEILNGASPIASYRDEELMNLRFRPGTPQPDKCVIRGGMRAVLFLWLTVDSVTVPHTLRHRFTFETSNPSGGGEERIVEGCPIDVQKASPVVIPPPFRSGTWAASNGPSNTSIHRRALVGLDAKMRIAQRFAFDWFKLGDKGKGEDDAKLVHDDATKNENWYGYGTEALAVADAVVSAVKDGIPENVPLSKTRAVPITAETTAGNYVVLNLGHGRFALYAHLQPHKIRVKVGDKVRRGQVLGLLGNSGNSDSPHLHFHIVDGDSPLGAEGLPFVFESYEVLGTLKDLGVLTRDNGWRPQPDATPEKRKKEIPLRNMIIRFP